MSLVNNDTKIMYKADALFPRILPVVVHRETAQKVWIDNVPYVKQGETHVIRKSWFDAKTGLLAILERDVQNKEVYLNKAIEKITEAEEIETDLRACDTGDWIRYHSKKTAKCHSDRTKRNSSVCALCVFNHEKITVK